MRPATPHEIATLPVAPEETPIVYIDLGHGRFTVVDAADAEWATQYRWNYRKGGYVQCTARIDGRRVTIQFHRALLNAPQGLEVDHIDGDGLNNRRSNLRLATRCQNQQNVGPRADSSTGSRGVSWKQAKRLFVARIQVNHRRIHLGYFETLEAAAAAAAEARRHMMPFSPEAREALA